MQSFLLFCSYSFFTFDVWFLFLLSNAFLVFGCCRCSPMSDWYFEIFSFRLHKLVNQIPRLLHLGLFLKVRSNAGSSDLVVILFFPFASFFFSFASRHIQSVHFLDFLIQSCKIELITALPMSVCALRLESSNHESIDYSACLFRIC